MFQMKKGLIHFLFSILILLTLIELALATTVQFAVSAGGEESRPINLAVEDHVVIKFTVLGQTDNTLDFSLTYPNGTVKDFGKKSTFNYAFVCDKEGRYFLNFTNANSLEDKTVTLDYEVEHYIFGMPQMLFLVLVIVLVCVAAVAVFIFMGKPR
jgi:hypothetical protein